MAFWLESINRGIGRTVAWLTLITVLICFATVYLRYALGIGFIWLQESYVWSHALAIMLGSGFALLSGGFVRVDMLNQRMSITQKALVEVLGTLLFLYPFALMLMYSGWGFFLSSWRMRERSAYEGGLPDLYILKGALLVFAILLAIQGSAILLRNLRVLLKPSTGTGGPPHGGTTLDPGTR